MGAIDKRPCLQGCFVKLRRLTVARNFLEDIASWGATSCRELWYIDASGGSGMRLERILTAVSEQEIASAHWRHWIS